MDNVAKFFETISTRLKSPIISATVISFIVVNWKAIFFLLFSNEATLSKFEFFDTNTSLVSIFLVPILSGFTYALIAPWLSYIGALLSKKPTELKTQLQIQSRRKLNEYKSIVEEGIVKKALRDEKVELIEDPTIRAQTKAELEKFRQKLEESELEEVKKKLEEAEYQEQQQILNKSSEKQIEKLQKNIEAIKIKTAKSEVELAVLHNALLNEDDASAVKTLKEMIKSREDYINNSDDYISGLEMEIISASHY